MTALLVDVRRATDTGYVDALMQRIAIRPRRFGRGLIGMSGFRS